MSGGVRTADLRLVLPALAAWLAAGLGVGAADARIPLLVLWLAAGVAGATIALTREAARPRLRAVLAVGVASLAAAALALTVTAVQQERRHPAVLAEAAHAGRAVVAEAELSAAPVDGRAEVRLRTVAIGGREWRVDAPALLFGRVPSAARVGGGIRFTGALTSADPGEDVAFLVFARGEATVSAPPPPLLGAMDALRADFVRTATRLPGDGGRLLPGLAVGDVSAVTDDLSTAMKGASLTHLTAVSGANCAVVVALAVALLGALGAPRILRLGAALALLGAFVVLVTPQPSVLRAAVMAALVLVAIGLGRPARGLPLLAAAVLALLVADPWLSRDYGFALSVLATGGLLTLAAPLADRLGRRLPSWLALALAVPIAAQLACQPVLLLLQPAVPLYGVPANLLAEPAAPIATIVGLIACVVGALAPPLALPIAALAWPPSAWIAAVARTASALPAAQLPWLPGVGGALLMALLTAAGIAVVLGRGRRRLRIAAAGLVLVALAGWSGGVAGSAVAAVATRPADWEYAMCDVGQGDASVIRSGGRIAVVDTGREPALMTRCLKQLGIARIQLLVLTHYDLDHVGGTDAVVGRVDRALLGPSSGPDDDRVAASLTRGGARVEHVARGLAGTLGDLDWRVLWPPPRGVEPGNPASVTLSVSPGPECRGGCLTGLFLGDLGQESQARLLGSTRLGHYDVVKVAHHGSADQEPALYARIRATIGLIGVGVDNDYGHPTAKLLGILADAGTLAARTDQRGLLLVADRGDGRMALWSERAPPAT